MNNSSTVYFFTSFLIIFSVFQFTTFAQEGAYVNSMSVTQGDTLKFYVSTSSNPFSMRITRFYSNSYTVRMGDFGSLTGGVQPVPSDAYMNGCRWPETFRMVIPDSWEPGMYRATFPTSNGGGGVIFFVKARNQASYSNTLLVLNTNTWQAYNTYGGKSLYPSNSPDRSYKVSFLRPSAHFWGAYNFFKHEMLYLDWSYQNSRKVEFATDYDIHSNTSLLNKYKVVVFAGHAEYWSLEQRNNIKNYLDSGGKVMLLSGNTSWWQVRFENNGNTLVCYKSSSADPMTGVNNDVVTVNWYASPVNNPENRLIGVSFRAGGYVNNGSTLPASQGYGDYAALNSHHWIYKGTNLKDGDEYGTASQIVGNEVDGALYKWENGLAVVTGQDGTPLNYRILGISPAHNANPSIVNEHGTPGIYNTSSGGALFNAATIRWVNGLASDAVVQKITDNIYTRFHNNYFPPDIVNWSPFNVRTAEINKESIQLNERALTAQSGDNITFSVNAVDYLNKSVNYRWYVGNNISGTGSEFNFTAGSENLYAIKAVVYNDKDSSIITWSIENSVIASVPPVPVLEAPASGSTNQPLQTVLSWKASSGAEFYNIQLSKTAGFENPVLTEQTTELNYSASLEASTTYYWRVRAGNTVGTSNYSTAWSFSTGTTNTIPAPVVLESPADGAENLSTQLELTWRASTGAEFYDLQVAKTAGFENPVITSQTTALKSEVSLEPSTLYYWRVRAGNTTGTTDYTVRSFSTGSTVPLPENVVLIYPGKNEKNLPLTIKFQWSRSAAAEFYRLEISTDKQFRNIFHSDGELTDTFKTVDGFQKKKNYWWRVSAGNQIGEVTSEVYQFATTNTNSPETEITHLKAYELNSNQKKTLALTWSSLQKSEGEYFEIQKRYDEGDWEVLTVMETSPDNKYSYNYNPHKDGPLSLRVVKYDRDGSILSEAEAGADINFTEYMLMQNYPNPFNPITNIDFILVADSRIVMKLYSITGELIRTLINDNLLSGVHTFELNGSELPSGIYFYSFEAVSADGMQQHSSVKKLILLK